MADKVVKKEVKTEVKTEVKKGRRKLKRSVRKTLGALFLATAIAVAAIPVDGLQAAPTDAVDADWGTLEGNMGADASRIPKVTKDDKIYTTGDGIYQFAYVAPTSNASQNKVAVILGYEKDRYLEGGVLEIPNTVDAYAQRTENLGTGSGYTAIGKSNEFLYYREVDRVYQDPENPWLDEEKKIPNNITVWKYIPCDYETINSWYYTDSTHKTERALEDFYYYPGNDLSLNPVQTTADQVEHQWIKKQTVRYIGNQYLESDGSGGWTVGTTGNYVNFKNKEDKGVFSKAGNIVHLTVGDEMSGIGDYAFYGCTNLESITLKNGMNTIGVGAFADCVNITKADIDVASMLNVIGDYAFYRCRLLGTFTIPNQVSRIGNSAFEGCVALTSVTMGGEGKEVLLNNMGDRVFKDCTSLKNITFKSQFSETMKLTVFQGCTALEYIELTNNAATFEANGEYTFEKFKAQMLSTFYFKGIKDSELHDTATTYQIPFSYYDSDSDRWVYELTVTEADNMKVVYRVDDDDNLIYCGPGKNQTYLPKTITMPETIGPNKIKVIDTKTFQNKCELELISIPSSITGIQAEAFVGCHQLEWVIFNNPNSELTIGEHAFQTQEGTCTNTAHSPNPYKDVPVLNFVGPISYDSEPFDYAMRPTESFDNDTQPRTHITYYSEWPAFLKVQYDPNKDENVLIDYPTLAELDAGKYKSTLDYPYLTQEQRDYTKTAVQNYKDNNYKLDGMISAERDVIDAALNLVLPEGIEGIGEKDGESLFASKDGGPLKADTNINKTITAMSIINVDEGAFKGHENLVAITFSDATKSIGTHAFEGCKNLTSVSLPGTVEKMGTRPFAGCENLSNVNFNGGPYFTCENSIIFELTNGTTKTKVVECLKGRANPMVDAKELAGVTALYDEAFKDTGVITVDLSSSRISKVPESCFENTRALATVTLPGTINGGSIEKNAFKDSTISVIRIPGQFINIDKEAFADADHIKDKKLIVWCDEVEEGETNMAADFARQNDLEPQFSEPEIEYEVIFYYYDDEGAAHPIGEPQKVKFGESAKAPDAPEKPGYTFDDYYPQTWKNVGGVDTTIKTYASYIKNDTETFTVVFQDYNGKVILKQTVAKGNAAIVPQSPSRMNEEPPWVFDGWVLSGGDGEFLTQQSSSLMNVQSDMVLIAQYHLAKEGETVDPGTGKTPSPNPGTSGSPNPGTSGSPNPGTSGSPGSSGTLYTLTVLNGSGSGSYVEGSQPFIIANDPATGQVFDHWSVSPEDVKIVSTTLAASIITMPAKDVTVTAHYKAGSGSGGSGSGGTGNGNNNQRPNGSSGSVTNGGTTVVIDKNGLSNTGVVSATVNGSSDNFTIKITESAAAAEAALRALMAEYGDDLTNIKYFPMDISLYDSTGTYKITDTTGLSVDITIPLPDSMITYAGNNKVASTAGDRIERLDARFSTIQGVSCVTFRAEHFSPYMIYVDLGNMSSGLVSDDTPKTGDGIHPKWFLSIGLACLSLVFFMQKDNRKQPKKVKVKVRAR